MRNYKKAISDFSTALLMSPKYAAAYSGRGLAYDSSKEYDKAISDYTKAIFLNPDDEYSYGGRGRVYGKLKKYDEAISDFLKTISLNPINASSYDDLGYMYLGKKDYQNAAANFAKCISLDGKNFDAMLGIAIAHYNLGNLNKVKSSILQAIAVEPGLAEGMAGIEKVEKEGYFYSDEDKRDLIKIFRIMGKTAPREAA
jgi:tetratricopeptide (TPR) repeat protein